MIIIKIPIKFIFNKRRELKVIIKTKLLKKVIWFIINKYTKGTKIEERKTKLKNMKNFFIFEFSKKLKIPKIIFIKKINKNSFLKNPSNKWL